ncbi:PP2C family protein-serine/threonine phosphatase [Methylacidimicrobium sp. B4]|uniref:PP2C family protein-serine/threonine phosphatase n=1 Tax=Methylacidimicrobium sp. B4 TaxID=2796139 RepID=UPI001A8D9C1E|nr:PP2C family protein-serine/threonine phosphatase [Methylacidimicrobium sp. B4]QSR85641.1 serine/threonine-protein phosphatase [Methylacidimicrobium sp. B4]
MLERLAALLKASAIALLSGGEGGEIGTFWGPGERSTELQRIIERYGKRGGEGDGSPAIEEDGSWTLLPLSGRGFLAVRLEPKGVVPPAVQSAALAVAEAALRLTRRSLPRVADRRSRLLEAELLAAGLFQASLFPRTAPALPGFRVAAVHLSAGELSGDFCDLLPITPHACGILVGDVAGKGIAAALVGGMCRVAVRSQVAASLSPSEVLCRVNRLLHGDLVERSLVAMLYAVIDTETREIRLARAGQEQPLLRQASGVVELDAPGFCLGIDSGESFDAALADVSLVLEPGDLLLFYTDGMTDAVAPCGAMFDKGRLTATLGRTGTLGAQASLEVLCQELASFRSPGGLADDVTLVALERVRS